MPPPSAPLHKIGGRAAGIILKELCKIADADVAALGGDHLDFARAVRQKGDGVLHAKPRQILVERHARFGFKQATEILGRELRERGKIL